MNLHSISNNVFQKIKEISKLLSQIDNFDLRTEINDKLSELSEVFLSQNTNYQKIFDATKDAIWLLDKHQNVLVANKSTEETFGFSQDNLINHHCYTHVHQTNDAVPNCPFIRSIKTLKREKQVWKIGKKWLEVIVDPIIDDEGNFAGGIHITRDITEQKETELELLNKEKELEKINKLFRSMADTMPDMLWAKDLDKRFIFVNEAICKILLGAKDTQEPIGKTDLFFAERQRKRHPENPEWHTFGEICIDSDEVTLRAKKTMRFDEYGNVEGKFLFLDVHKAPMYNDDGEIIGIVGSARDVTQQKLFEKILRESESRYKELFETAPVGYVILDKNGILLDANETVLKRFGYEKFELVGHDIREFVPEEDINIVNENIKTILSKGYLKTEASSLSKSGKQLELLLREKKIKLPNGEDGILSASIDITKRKEAEKALREHDEQIITLINSAPEDIICFKDAEHRWLLANNTLLQLLGLEEFDYVGKTDIELSNIANNKDALYQCYESDNQAWEAKKTSHFIETITKNNNEKYIFDIVKVPLFKEDGSRKGLVLFGRNITKLEEAQRKIKESEEKFRSVWENSLDAMRLQDENEQILYVNKAFCNMAQLPREKIINRKITEIFKVKKRASSNYRKSFREENLPSYHKTEITLLNGKTIILELSNSFIELKDGKKLLLTIFRDVTEYQNLLNEMTEAKNKAEEINRIKTQFFLYMSHELRTPFMGIIGYAQLLEEKAESEEHKYMARQILKTSARMIDTLSNILDLTKLEFDSEEIFIEKLNINNIIRETHNSFVNMAEIKNISLNVDLPQEPIFLDTDIRMITSILNNLVNNAIKFTEKGFVEISARIMNNTLILKIKDTGIGIPKEKQEMIWEEFRQVSEGATRNYQGSGIGLTIVKKYVTMFNGKISLESEINKGSTFTVIIPLSNKLINGVIK